MPSMYRTALGKIVDMDQIRATNEEVVAIGNMRVNARGDLLDRNGQVIEKKDQVMSKQYGNRKGYNIPQDEPVMSSKNAAKAAATAKTVKADNLESTKLHETIAKLQEELAKKDAIIEQTNKAGKSLIEATAEIQPDVIVPDETADVSVITDEITVIEPQKIEAKNLRGGLANAIQKNLELQTKKTKPKRI